MNLRDRRLPAPTALPHWQPGATPQEFVPLHRLSAESAFHSVIEALNRAYSACDVGGTEFPGALPQAEMKSHRWR